VDRLTEEKQPVAKPNIWGMMPKRMGTLIKDESTKQEI
jgi:hypothetical protein